MPGPGRCISDGTDPVGSDIGLRVSRSPNTPTIITTVNTSETEKTSRLAPGASVMCMKKSTTSEALTMAITSAR